MFGLPHPATLHGEIRINFCGAGPSLSISLHAVAVPRLMYVDNLLVLQPFLSNKELSLLHAA